MTVPATWYVQMHDTVAFATAEFDAIHALCDRALVPRTVLGELLSASQRVAVLEGCYVGLAARLGMDPPSVIH